MSRNLYGGGEDDYAVDAAGNPAQNRRVHFYTGTARTTEITDLASDAAGTGTPLTVTTDSQGFWGPVYGPDGTTVMYAGAEDSKGNAPTRVVAVYPHNSTGGGVSTFNTRTGDITLAKADVTATGLAASDVGAENVVVHGSTASTARPSGATVVHWIGSVQPNNAATNDEWTDTANKAVKRYTGSVWDTIGSASSSTPPYELLAAAPSGDTTGATDTAAIQALIDTVAAGGDGGTVQLRAGIYYSNGLVMKSLVTLRGAGWRTIVQGAASTAVAVIGSPGSGALYGAEVCDLRVNGARCSTTSDGINLTSATSAQPNGMLLSDATNRVRNCVVQYAGRDGVVFGHSGATHSGGEGEGMLSGCYVEGSGRYGVLLDAFDCQMWNCTVGVSAQHGVVIQANNCRVYNTKSWYAGRDYYPTASLDTLGSGSASYDGFFITQPGGGGNNAIQLSGCQSQDNGRYGLNCNGVSGVKISGHMFGGENVAAFRIGSGASIVLDGTLAQGDRGVTPVIGIFDANGSGHQISLHYDGAQAATANFQYVNGGSARGTDIRLYATGGGTWNYGNVSGSQTPNYALATTHVFTFTGNGTIANTSRGVPGQQLEILVNAGANTIAWGTQYHTIGGGALPTTGSFSARFRNITENSDTPYWLLVSATGA
jgi:hypothetical protein